MVLELDDIMTTVIWSSYRNDSGSWPGSLPVPAVFEGDGLGVWRCAVPYRIKVAGYGWVWQFLSLVKFIITYV